MNQFFWLVYLSILACGNRIVQAKFVPSVDSSKVIDTKKDSNSNQTRRPRSSLAWKRASIEEQTQIVLDEEAELDETTYWTFTEKERHDGFKRTAPEDNPYSVLIYVQLSTAAGPVAALCSGSLLTSHWVLTAAHCFALDVQRVVVYAGGNSLKEFQSHTPAKSSQLREADIFYQHPSYNPAVDVLFDVAVVKVAEAFEMTSTVKTIQLTKVPWTNDQYKDCIFTGFGQVFHERKDTDDHTRKTHCFEMKNSCPCKIGPAMDDVIMCSRPREDYGICEGDSGGGLVCNGKVVAVACSVAYMADVDSCNMTVSEHPDCGVKNTLSLFIKSDPYLTWINGKVNKGINNRSGHLVGIVGSLLLYIGYQNIL